MVKASAKWLIVNFPIIIVTMQVMANLLYAFYPSLYRELFFFISGMCGMNWVTSLFMVAFTFYFRFCEVSRWCAISELIFCTFDLIVNGDAKANNQIQLFVGLSALLITGIILNNEKKIKNG